MPLLLPLILFIIGIVTGNFWYAGLLLIGVSFVILLIVNSILASGYIKSYLLLALFFLSGLGIQQFSLKWEKLTHFSFYEGDNLTLIIQKTLPTKKGYKSEARVLKVNRKYEEHSVSGKIIIYTPATIALQTFSTYEIPAQFVKIESYHNPGYFDYGTFLHQKGFYHQIYLKEEPELIDAGKGIRKLIYDVSGLASDVFYTSFDNERIADLVTAIFLGQKEGLSKESKQLFTDNGLAHLLAISGMHVGIIYLILSWVFGWLRINSIRSLVIIFGIWFYIILTGLQIPALRAGFMFTVFIIGKISSRNVKSLNSIFFAAIILLAINPNLIYQVSFQLSFAAMLSILSFYNPIQRLYVPDQIWLRKIWQLTSLNVSVQIFVLPLTIFYFKQLPTYFLFTSLISIPFVVAIMWGAIILLMSDLTGFLDQFLGALLESFIEFYFSILTAVSKLPFALIIDLQIHYLQIIGWTLGVLIIYHLLQLNTRKYSMMYSAFIPLILISSSLKIKEYVNHSIIIYDDPKEVIVDLNVQGQIFRMSSDPDYTPYSLKDSKVFKASKLANNSIYQMNNLTWALIDKDLPISNPQPIDICILGSPNIKSSDVSHCKKIIIPRHLKSRYININYYNILSKGAFKQNF